MTTHWRDALRRMAACTEAIAWCKRQVTLAAAWVACERGDWMLWLLGRLLAGPPESASRKRLVLAACACARLALPHVRKGEERPRMAIETAERWARDDGATLDEVRDAAAAADVGSSARKAVLSRCADIVRAHYPEPPQLGGSDD